jgi:hypothetical protein
MCPPPSSACFEVHLMGSGDLYEDARALHKALWKEGHRAWLARDEWGAWFVAVSVGGPAPQRQLEQAMRQTGLFGSFGPLERRVEEWLKV